MPSGLYTISAERDNWMEENGMLDPFVKAKRLHQIFFDVGPENSLHCNLFVLSFEECL